MFPIYLATKSVSHLVEKLPDDGTQKYPSSEVVINICGVLNNLVTSSSLAARDISFFGGVEKLMGIKNSHDRRCVTRELDKRTEPHTCPGADVCKQYLHSVFHLSQVLTAY